MAFRRDVLDHWITPIKKLPVTLQRYLQTKVTHQSTFTSQPICDVHSAGKYLGSPSYKINVKMSMTSLLKHFVNSL